jgi:hypothetical protein
MSRKRFTDADKWEDGWFSEQPSSVKLFWIYLCDRCDQAGVWDVSWKLAAFHLGDIDPVALKAALAGRVTEIAGGKKWFVPGFVTFQYPSGLSKVSPPHLRIRATLVRHGLDPDTLCSALSNRVKTAPEEVDEEEDKEKDSSSPDPEDVFGTLGMPIAPISDADHWRMQVQHEPWVKTILDAMCIIGPGTWRKWQALLVDYSLPTVVSAAKGIGAKERWPSNVLDALTASRGQANPGDAINPNRVHKVTL